MTERTVETTIKLSLGEFIRICLEHHGLQTGDEIDGWLDSEGRLYVRWSLDVDDTTVRRETYCFSPREVCAAVHAHYANKNAVTYTERSRYAESKEILLTFTEQSKKSTFFAFVHYMATGLGVDAVAVIAGMLYAVFGVCALWFFLRVVT